MFSQLGHTFLETLRDVLPVVVFIVVFQLLIIRQPVPRPRRLVTGCVWVIIGLTLFLVGLERALFPIGRLMAQQLSAPEFVFGSSESPEAPHWRDYAWTYVFGALIGFSTTIAEPAALGKRSSKKAAEGLVTSTMPSFFISNTPTSDVAPKRFLTLRSSR